MHGPHPTTAYPLAGYAHAVFLNNFITRDRKSVV